MWIPLQGTVGVPYEQFIGSWHTRELIVFIKAFFKVTKPLCDELLAWLRPEEGCNVGDPLQKHRFELRQPGLQVPGMFQRLSDVQAACLL